MVQSPSKAHSAVISDCRSKMNHHAEDHAEHRMRAPSRHRDLEALDRQTLRPFKPEAFSDLFHPPSLPSPSSLDGATEAEERRWHEGGVALISAAGYAASV